jgi:hypothetical protein
LLLKPENYFIARNTATTEAQQKVIDGLWCKIINPLCSAPETKGGSIDKSMHNIAITQVVYNADNVLLWLNMIARDRASTLHAAFAKQIRWDSPVTTVLTCIEHVHIDTVKKNCGL